jgi:hypothetical protein
MSSLSFALFTSNQPAGADFTLSTVRKFYPDTYVCILPDANDGYTDLAHKYNAECFYPLNRLGYPSQPFGWRKKSVIDFLERLHIACLRCNTTHIMYTEEDVVIFKPLNIPDDAELIGFKTCYPDGSKFPNGFPNEFMRIIEEFSGVKPNVTSYGAQGGCVLKVDTFVDNFQRIKKFISENLDYIQDNIYPTAGWIDCFLTWFYLLCGKRYIFNPNYMEVFDRNFEYSQAAPQYEIATHYKKHYK